ncbi:hypothetical protein ACP70R_000059 [Stipagrostis hirtigluma subsp. patula]
MGEEVKKVEEEAKVEEQKKEDAPAAAEAEKKEEAPAPAAAEGEEKEEEAAKQEPPPPPPPVILGIDLHCTGCANKIKRCILRCKGVEGVEVDMAQNQVTVKGIVDPQAICERLRKRTMRSATVISPPPPPPPADDQPAPPPAEAVVHSQVSEVTTVELLVNMHCEACAQQLQKKILKMRGVQTADANPGAGKLTVTGTMSADKLVQYIHRRTGKLATVVPPPPPPEPPKAEDEPKKEDGDKKPEEPPAEAGDKKEDPEKPPEGDAGAKKDGEGEKKEEEAAKPDDAAGEKKEDGGGGDEKAKPEVVAVDGFPPEEMMKRMMYWPYSHKHFYSNPAEEEAMMARRMAMAHPCTVPMPMMQWMPPPPPPPPPVAPPMMYPHYGYGMMDHRPPPAPELFSDENPNACVIS